MNTNSHHATNIATFDERAADQEYKWQQNRIEKICEILRGLPVKKVGADVGCCNGMATPAYAEAGIKTLHGFDISEASLEQLRAKGFEGFYWNVDGGRCPLPDATYDVMIAGEVIEHIIDTDSFVQELYRLLKPGGYAIITTPNLASWYNRLRLLRGQVPTSYPGASIRLKRDPMIDLNHIRVNVLSEWQYLLEQHHFKLVGLAGSSHLQVWQGGWRIALVKWLDRQFQKHPHLAVNLIMVFQRPV